MATSGTLKTNTTYDSYFWVKWSIKGDQDIVNNKTTINWSCGVTPGHQFYTNAIKMSAVTINGEKVYSGGTYSNFTDYKEHTLGSGTLDIPHSTDGTKTFTISSFTGWLHECYNYSASSTPYTLPTIPRSSSVSCTTVKVGETAEITINRASSSYTHTLRYVFGNLSGDIATTSNKVDTSASFPIPTTFYDKIPNSKSGTGTIYCKTYNGTTQIGDETDCKFTVTVDEETNKPTIAPTIQDSNYTTEYATGSRNVFVKGYSNASYTIGAEAKNGASIDSILITCGELKGTTDSGVLNGVQSGTFKITVKDSRGFIVTQTIEKELVNYIPLTCVMDVSEISANGDVTITFRGNCYKGKFGSASSRLNENFTHIMYKYKEEGGEYGSWSQIDFIPSDNNTYSETAQIHGLNHQKAYTFYAQVADIIEEDWIKLPEVTRTSVPIFDWGKNDFNFNVPVNVNGGLNVNNNITFENGEQTDARIIRFQNSNGEQSHNCTLYGGNPNSTTGIGFWDDKGDGRGVLWYNDVSNIVNISNPDGLIKSQRRLKVLASSTGSYMNASQSITLDEKVSTQLNGIVVAWSYYDGTEGVDYDWNYTFIPKEHVLRHEGKGIDCPIIWYSNSNGLNFASKYLYVNDSSITGYAGNSSVANNAKFVLRYVYGV